MEQARDLDTIIFDKTGTLTKGEQGVINVTTVEDIDEDEAVSLAAAVFGSMDSEAAFPRTIQIPHETIVSDPNTTAEFTSGTPIGRTFSPVTVKDSVCSDSDRGGGNNRQ